MSSIFNEQGRSGTTGTGEGRVKLDDLFKGGVFHFLWGGVRLVMQAVGDWLGRRSLLVQLILCLVIQFFVMIVIEVLYYNSDIYNELSASMHSVNYNPLILLFLYIFLFLKWWSYNFSLKKIFSPDTPARGIIAASLLGVTVFIREAIEYYGYRRMTNSLSDMLEVAAAKPALVIFAVLPCVVLGWYWRHVLKLRRLALMQKQLPVVISPSDETPVNRLDVLPKKDG